MGFFCDFRVVPCTLVQLIHIRIVLYLFLHSKYTQTYLHISIGSLQRAQILLVFQKTEFTKLSELSGVSEMGDILEKIYQKSVLLKPLIFKKCFKSNILAQILGHEDYKRAIIYFFLSCPA